MIPKDTLWKGIIEDLVEDFVRYFFTDFIEQIDFSNGFTFLDKELEQLFPKSESKKRHADKLFRAQLLNGAEQWFLVHVEVQGYADPDFATRMFEYAYRIKDRYKKPLTALAIYTNENRKYHFTEYYESFMGSEITYRFNTYVLVDKQVEDLHRPNNLFGLVMEVAFEDLLNRNKTDLDRLNFKTRLVKRLLKQGIDRLKIRRLLAFIKYYTNFERKEFFLKFEEGIYKITKPRKAMGIEEAILNYVEEKGIEKGIEKGKEEGYAKGFEEGEVQGEATGEARGVDLGIRMVITRAWEKGMPVAEIADLTNKTIEEVEIVIKELKTFRARTSEEEE